MDALSDVLKTVRLEGAVYIDGDFTAPWCIRGKYGLASIRDRMAGADHVMFFHYLVEGRCRVRIDDGGEPLDVEAGDVVLFPWDDRHLMGSDLHLAPLESETIAQADPANPALFRLRGGGGGAPTRFVCSYLACTRSVVRPLLEALPRVVRIPIDDGRTPSMLSGLMRHGVDESTASRPGAQSLLARLAELLFVEALRRYVASLPPAEKGWLAGVRDLHVGRALAMMHEQPNHAWTVDELARRAAMSRSALAERFAALLGEPPIRYLKRWRLALAARMLRAGEASVARVAERSGYESEAAFNRAFKREFGMPPAAWRRSGADAP